MKKIIKKLLNVLGYEIRKLNVNRSLDSKKTNHLTFHKTATGNYFLPTDAYQDVVANTIIDNLIFEKEVVDIALSYIKENTSVLDIGSNFGQMSVIFSNHVGENGKVYAFDADDFVYGILKKNIAANGKESKILPTFGAVHNVEGETLYFPEQDFKAYGAYGAYGIDYNSNSGRNVTSLTIDSLNIQDPISFMKIDIQGGDLQAMQGAINTIKKHKMPILFEYEYHFEDLYKLSFQDYVDFVLEIGYIFKKVVNGHNFLIIPKP